MIAVTHPGKIGDFGSCLPICSWLYKTYNEKIIFVLPVGFPFMEQAESLIRLQPFTEDIIYCDFHIYHYDVGGQPYKFNPHDYVPNLNISRYYNFGCMIGHMLAPKMSWSYSGQMMNWSYG